MAGQLCAVSADASLAQRRVWLELTDFFEFFKFLQPLATILSKKLDAVGVPFEPLMGHRRAAGRQRQA